MIDRRRWLQVAGGVGLAGCGRRPAPVEEESPARQALLIGVTTYPRGTPWPPLAGPANDVNLWASILGERLGFSEEGMTRLTEATVRPTRAAIKQAFAKLAANARPGGQTFVLLSGHGTQQPDQVPPDPDDPEPNGMDQVFLPADAGKPDLAAKVIPNGIIDDEIRLWMRAIAKRGSRVWLVCDCCHAGTMLRGCDDESGLRGVPASRVWPAEIITEARRNGVAPRRGASVSPLKIGRDAGIVAFYACGPDQRTGETYFSDRGGDRKLGIFTQALCGLVDRSPRKPTYRALIDAVLPLYQSGAAAQLRPVPFAEGDGLDQPILGEAVPDRAGFELVRTEKGWLLRAGELQGLYPGTVLAVAGKRGYARLTQAGPLSSIVEPTAYAGQPLCGDWPEHVMAHPVFLAAPRRKVPVWIGAVEGREALARAAEQVGGVRLVARPTLEAWRVEADRDGTWLTTAGFAPRLRVMTGRDLASNLSWIARGAALLGLASAPGPSLGLQLEVRKLQGKKWVGMKLGERVRNGDKILASVRNKGGNAADVTLLYVDHNYRIAPFLPDPAKPVPNRVAPGKEITTAIIDVNAAQPEADRLVLVAVEAVGERFAEFTCLAMPTLAQARGSGDSPLVEFLAGSLFGVGARGIAVTHRHQLAAISWISEP